MTVTDWCNPAHPERVAARAAYAGTEATCTTCHTPVVATLDRDGITFSWIDRDGRGGGPHPDLPPDPWAELARLADVDMRSYMALKVRLDTLGAFHVHRVA